MNTPEPSNESEQQKDIRLNKDMAAFSYVWIISVILYASRRDSPFIRYHSRQAMILFFVSILLFIIPFIGNVLVLLPIAGMLYGFVTAAQGQYSSIPIITPLAKGEMSIADAGKIVENAIKEFMKSLRHSRGAEESKEPQKKSEESPPSPPTS